ncbi:uncharacterized protein LOC122017752 isoform X2 [Zingiber officinale]|uniref:Outer arm dynein light chain 1 protein n=1 Tax=Zingiber officinale TaxID=94328 RepID=A0A8J5FLS5_ZINOF|nr:uncharacterized protein LOC122017752 isoform X1 [Zingiber officinale]XP_042431370.1 uncharacterized protein LOC122017752 isoform X2 [Zingiber officinale]KAG6483204.1 hypothetical protein ZIOFF_059846 [Zingiber officinale]
MAIVTGDRYLEQLLRFVERNADTLLEGSLTLKLNPVGLRYVHSRLEALRELEGLLAGAPVDYLRAYVSDLGDHRALEQLRRILALLTSLKVVSVLPPPARDPTTISLLPFGRLKDLELRGCDLSTSSVRGLLELRHTLEKLICYNSTECLRHVFASRIVDIKESPTWKRLKFVSCACNQLVVMDESLQLLPSVETLDLSRNRFAKIDNLQKIIKLRYLDLGFNHLRSVARLSEVSSKIVKLVLRYNALTSVHGIGNLKSLEELDLSYNIISSFTTLETLGSLLSLHNLWLEGNPICCSRWFRAHVFSFFSNPERLDLDGKRISTREYWERHVIFANNQKKPAGCGFYFPAKSTVEDESIMAIRKKKYFRLASIEDEKERRLVSSDQESVSCDSESLRKDEIISDSVSRIDELMNVAKYMKNEQSPIWLREFKKYLDQTTDKLAYKNQSMEFGLAYPMIRQEQGHKQFGSSSSSKYIIEIAETLEGETSRRILDFNMAVKDSDIGNYSSKEIMQLETSKNDSNISLNGRNSGFNSEQGKSNFYSVEPIDVSHLKVKLHSGDCDSADKGYESENAPLTAIEKIIGSHPSSQHPNSPPHYREDILHHRFGLKEEFLQHSDDATSVETSDTDTSSSGGVSHNLSSSSLDSLLSQALLKQTSSNNSLTSLDIQCLAGGRHFRASMRGNCVEVNQEDDNYPSYAHGISSNGEDSFNHIANHAVDGSEKQKGKSKLKRRLISLSGNLNTEPILDKPNGNGVSQMYLRDAHGERSMTCRDPGSHVNLNHSTDTGVRTLNPAENENLKDFLHLKIVDFSTSETETIEDIVCCDCIFQLGMVVEEREVAILRTCERKIYVIFIDTTPNDQEVITKVVGCHKLEDMREILVGLGLQALRIYLEGKISYLFLTRSSIKLENLLSLLQISESAASYSIWSLKSWENVQVKMLEKYVCGIPKLGLFLYSMLLFWNDNSGGESWVARSIMVVEEYMLVCIENFLQFGTFVADSGTSSPYYSLHSGCTIRDILEMVIELSPVRCVTLTFADVLPATNFFSNKIKKERQLAETPNLHTWKLKWYSDDALLKFVALVKAIYLGLKSSPLPVKCIS